VASETIDPVHSIFRDMAEELELQTLPDAGQCMLSVMEKHHPEPHLLGFLTDIGRCLGKVDLEGQVRELEMIHDRCVQVCAQLQLERKEKTQLVRTLGLCAGAVLVILLF
jgi:stage III sporulation protein AB